MNSTQSLCHTKWDCKYHIVWIPKCRRKVLYGRLRKYLGELLHILARQKECKILEGHLCSDHVHILISILPKYSVAQVIGFIKGKSAIHIARMCLGQKKTLPACTFGHAVTLYQQLVLMRKQPPSTSEIRKMKTSA
jgi:putative transposase